MLSTILITGGAGYIGSHIALLLVQQGYDVVILDNLRHGQTFNHSWGTFINGDLSDKKLLDDIFSHHTIDAVMHFAASAEVGRSLQQPLDFYANNVSNTVTLLQTMIAHGVKKFIFSSSCAVYGTPHIIPIPEDHPKNPISPYGKTKLMVETILEDAQRAHGLQYVALRYFNAAGAKPEHGLQEVHNPETHLIPLLLQATREQKPFYIFGNDYPTEDGTCVRDFLHVWDIAYAHLKALEHLNNGNPSDCFNLGTGHGFSVKQIIDAAQNICNTKIKTIVTEKRAGDPPVLIADASRARNILQWEPRFSWSRV